MIKKIICYIIGYKMMHKDRFYPNMYAEVVTKWEHKSTCLRCGNIEEFTWRYKDGM